MKLTYDYDKTSKIDILRHGKELEDCVIGDVYLLELNGKSRQDFLEKYSEEKIIGWIDSSGNHHKGDKGRIGNMVQEVYFDVPVNSIPDADLKKAGVEIKVSPLIDKPRAGLRVKERLVLGMIKKEDILPDSFFDSHVYDKCKLILLTYYIDETNKNKLPFQFPFYKSIYFKIPEKDMAIIKQDYNYIRDCVNQNRYNDLHESQAKYLSPCPKNGKRAYSLKQAYMNQILEEYLIKDKLMYSPENEVEFQQEYDSVIDDYSVLSYMSFEDVVLNKIKPYIGMTASEIVKKLGGFGTEKKQSLDDKALFARITYTMLGIKSTKAEEFVKANIYVKTLRVEKNNTMNEKISFPAFEFKQLIEEEWNDSQVYEEMVERRFLWSVFKNDGKDYVFKGVHFWNLPVEDESVIKKGWEDIREIVRNGVKFAFDKKETGEFVETQRGKHRILNNFPDTRNTNPKRKEYKLCPSPKPLNEIISIRPHTSLIYYNLLSINYKDTDSPSSNGSELPNGDVMTKQCFWFNNEYILKQLKEFLK